MIILGVDPGIARVGWAVLSVHHGNPGALSYGCITTLKNETPERRLVSIHKAIVSLCKKYNPDSVSVEELFFSTNVKTAIHVGQARGIILLAAAQSNIPVVSYSPSTVKQTICGSGAAKKDQVQKMVTRILKLKTIPTPDDTADALAIALTHAYSYRMKHINI
jgi:crossover junction endodeoxyribonuclease RuvC